MVWANMNVAQRTAQMVNPIYFLVNTNPMFYSNNLESNLTQADLARSLLLSHFISKLKNVADKKLKFKPGKKKIQSSDPCLKAPFDKMRGC